MKLELLKFCTTNHETELYSIEFEWPFSLSGLMNDEQMTVISNLNQLFMHQNQLSKRNKIKKNILVLNI